MSQDQSALTCSFEGKQFEEKMHVQVWQAIRKVSTAWCRSAFNFAATRVAKHPDGNRRLSRDPCAGHLVSSRASGNVDRAAATAKNTAGVNHVAVLPIVAAALAVGRLAAGWARSLAKRRKAEEGAEYQTTGQRHEAAPRWFLVSHTPA